MRQLDLFSRDQETFRQGYRVIEKAESYRRRGNYEEMVASRRELLEVDPEVFSAYMARVG